MKVCKGCGAILQTEDNKKEGFVRSLEYEYCLNCFSIKHYNKPLVEISRVHFPIVKDKGLVVYLISVFHLNVLFKYDLKKFYPDNDIILLINKVDLLPMTVNFDVLTSEIKKEAAVNHIKLFEVMPISALKGKYLEIFLETITHYGHKNVYFVGLQNSGKSTLINRIAQHLEKEEVALTSKFPGLTQGNISFKYNNQTLIDTPGVFEGGFISDYLPYEEFNKLIINKRVKPVNYNLDPHQSIIVGGFLIVSFIKGDKTNFTFYLGNINLHRTKYENVYSVFEKHKGELFKPTVEEKLEKRFMKLEESSKYTISLFDLGYLVVKGPITLELYAPKGANIILKKGSYHGL